jgi:hypothetical protein
VIIPNGIQLRHDDEAEPWRRRIQEVRIRLGEFDNQGRALARPWMILDGIYLLNVTVLAHFFRKRRLISLERYSIAESACPGIAD